MILYGLNPNQMIPTAQALRQKGKAARAVVTFVNQGTFNPVNRDVNTMIDEQNRTRLPELIDLRRERMAVSPFTFYRGTALIMAHDLSHQAITGAPLIICGDAHINNFGLYASPERRLAFDLNDFDEAAPGPWEWDLKRLITSIFLCGEDLGLSDTQVKEAAIKAALAGDVEAAFEAYKQTVRADIALLLSQHLLTDVARRVVGVGSVGTRCYLLVLTCENASHLVLQIKEASPSVVSRYNPIVGSPLGKLNPEQNNGLRVTTYQQILQAYSDPFLGHFQANGRDFYVRQFRDMKGSFEMNELTNQGFLDYVEGCGLMLARAHAQSPNANYVAGYMGKSDNFEKAIVKWCYGYSRQVYRDYENFVR
ncbi:DUF2252 domain-containing protein [Acetobacterium sp.]|uniref:DUF2252 domain-containing protein n=1 Tax=Acetobacterium sp. TaxID=1872094 RepID=UPI002720AD84|nr:DUF2252 domain-containing protein [Acetobacterium sp.]MDO9494030.1 DUF2252 domain-containing protein [Acetobacterium sp.]